MQPDPADTNATAVEVRKSPNDKRSYEYLTLPNELRVLLVSDPSSEKAAAALSVYRGSFHEPQERPGLAHFLEHMLFIQTQTYPEVDGFQHYVSGNGGSSNAYTALDHTNYFFDIRTEAFPEALDRFAHFFIDPVLSAEYSAREKNAVHSEYQMQLKDDGWRGYMVSKQTLNPQHPGSRFTIGSLATLAGDIHEDLVAFFEEHYSADQMGLVVLSSQSLDELRELVTPVFSRIQNNNVGPIYPGVPIYTDEELPVEVRTQAQKAGTSVSYGFVLPNTRKHYRTKPELYFTNLLGHEGKGSLYQALNARGWVESLSASIGELDRNDSMLSIHIDLTESGAGNIPRITDVLFQYIDLIKSTPPEDWIYREQATIAELGFRFQENSNPMGFVYQMAPRIDRFPPGDLLVAPYLMEAFDADLITEYLEYVHADNMIVEIVSDSIEGELVEPWFRVPYSLSRTTAERTATPEPSLALPQPNPYLPGQLDLNEEDEVEAELTIDQPGIRIWLDQDVSYGAPRANTYLELAVTGGFVTPAERAKAQLYRLLVEDALSEVVYPAYLAGLGYGLGISDAGFEVSIGGYQDKQHTLLGTVMDALLNTQIDTGKFDNFKKGLIRDWGNTKKDRPFSQAFSALADVLRSGRWPRDMLVDALTPVTPEQLAAWRNNLLNGFHVQGLTHGNVDQDDVTDLANLISQTLPVATHPIKRASVEELDRALRLQLPVDHNDAAMVLHIQDEDDSFRSRALSSLAAQILHNAYFLELRTQQQLGYVVSVSNRPVVNRGGISFIVQSPVKSSAGLESATREFLDAFIERWQDVPEEELAQQKAGLINRLTQSPKNLNDKSQRYWGDLVRGHLTFDSREQIADEVASLTREDMAAFWQRLSDKFSTERLIVFTQGKFDEVPEAGILLETAVSPWNEPAIQSSGR